MTRADAVHLVATDTRFGCAGCGDQRTVQLHPRHGRLCSGCVTIPPGPFQRELAADMVDFGRADAAFGYLGAWLHRRIDERFATAALSLSPVTVGRLTGGFAQADVVVGRRLAIGPAGELGPVPFLRTCWCGRPIRDDDAVECAEHDDAPRTQR